MLRQLYHLWAVITFISLMLFIFPFVLLSFVFGQKKAGKFIWRLIRFWSKSWLFLIGIKLEKIHAERADTQRQYIYIGNHQRYIDAPVMALSIPQYFRALGAAEYARYPVFGEIYKSITILVNRQDKNDRTRSFENLKQIFMSQKVSLLIMPEGKTNPSEDIPLLPFQNGAFRIAIETQTPIQAMVFVGVRACMKTPFPMQAGTIKIIYLPTIEVAGLGLEDIEKLKQSTHQLILDTYLKYETKH